jgi:hypothetical protein
LVDYLYGLLSELIDVFTMFLGVINGSNKVKVEIDVEKMNQFFVTRSLPQNELDFKIPDFCPITLFPCLSKVCEVLMASDCIGHAG